MRRGPKRNVISFETAGGTIIGYDDLQTPIYSEATWRDVFAEVLPVRGAETFDRDGSQRYSQSLYRFVCDYYDADGISTKTRLRFDGRIFDIVNIRPDYQKHTDTLIEATIQDETV